MKSKKTTKADLETKRGIFFQIGLILSLGIVLYAFKVSKDVEPVSALGEIVSGQIDEDPIPITRRDDPEPPPPPPSVKIFDELFMVDDNTIIEDELEIFNSEADDETIIDAIPLIDEDDGNADDASVFDFVEIPPEFPGGQTALLKYIHDHVDYPFIAAENGLQDKVIVQFVIDTDGGVSNTKILRGEYSSLNQEALRVISTLPKWKPGQQGGKKVRVSYRIPVNFKLQ